MDNSKHEGGWKVLLATEQGGEHILTIKMTSIGPCKYSDELHDELHNELIAHEHRISSSTDSFEFDHYPTDSEINEAVLSTGFNPILDDVERGVIVMYGPGNLNVDPNNGKVSRKLEAIRTITNGKEVIEYNAILHPKEYMELFNMIPIDIKEAPSSMSLKEDWLHLYYVNATHTPPSQFFDEDFHVYSVRINKNTGEFKRKGYHIGMTLSPGVTKSLIGFKDMDNILATGVYLDEPLVTLYHMKSSDKSDYVDNPLVTDVPYYGTTFENGVIIRTREYRH